MKMKITRWFRRDWPELLTDTCDYMEVDIGGNAVLWDRGMMVAMFPSFKIVIVEMGEE